MWSTIKTLPATLPEPSFMDRGPRTGVTGAVSPSDLHYVRGWGRRARAVVRGSRTLVDGLAEAVGWAFRSFFCLGSFQTFFLRSCRVTLHLCFELLGNLLNINLFLN